MYAVGFYGRSILISCNIKHAYGIIMSKLPILLSLLLLIVFYRKTCCSKEWRSLIKTMFAESA
jgi:hypothetical protein